MGSLVLSKQDWEIFLFKISLKASEILAQRVQSPTTKPGDGAGEMTQWVRALAASSQMSLGSDALFWPPQAPGTFVVYRCANRQNHKK